MSSLEIAVTVNGETIPAEDLTWFFTAKCGCLEGVSMARDQRGQLITDEGAAFRKHYWTAREAKTAQRRGVTAHLGKRSDLPNPWTTCSHNPKWGEES